MLNTFRFILALLSLLFLIRPIRREGLGVGVFRATPASAAFKRLARINSLNASLFRLSRLIFFKLTLNTSFIPRYYHRSELIWLDGFLFDFLQKKSVDAWLRKFVINTGYIFSERMVFDQVVGVYLNNIIWPLHYIGALETDNVSEMLSIVIFLYFFLIALLALVFFIF